MRIADLQIPEPVKSLLIRSGIVELYPPQEDAIKAGVLDGKNLVLASPTASGKTLIAELCAVKHMLERGKVLYLCPLRALASEKYEEFKKYSSLKRADDDTLKIGISTGDYDSADAWLGSRDIIITTNEKADSLLRHRAKWIEDVTLVVADEIHLLDDSERGPTLEVVLARLLQVNPNLQVLALSATLKNVDEIATWLKADYVTTDWRPVPLKEGILLHDEVQYKDGDAKKIEKRTKDSMTNMILHTVRGGGQVLVFTSTRRNTSQLAKKISGPIEKTLCTSAKLALEHDAETILLTGEKTRISELLSWLVGCGVAFHHAGLGNAHRKIIEDAFRQGRIKVLTATPTLAFGINLPARVVIIQDYRRYESEYGYYPIRVLEYKQMAGRAGRPKYDRAGESVILSKTEDEADYLFKTYLLAGPEQIWSKLAVEHIMRSHVLSTIAADFAHTEQGIYDFFGKTFYAYQYTMHDLKKIVTKILKFLYDERMIEVDGENINATRFGKRVSDLYIDPVSAVIMRDALAQKQVETSEISFLHLITHTPDMTPMLRSYAKERDGLTSFAEQHAKELFVAVPNEWEDRMTYERFLAEIKTARTMQGWIDEMSEDSLIGAFGVQPGDLYRVLENAKWLLNATHELALLFDCRHALPQTLELMLRIDKGVKKELLPLVRLSGVGRVRGRILYNAGYKTVEDVKQAKAETLAKLPLIGLKLAAQIIEQSRGRKEEPHEETVRRQKLLTDF